MEILIFGGALVALMVYTSTRIKRVAKEAYQEELVERPDFTLIKPEGFLELTSPAVGLAFEAHSKGFGEEETTEAQREALASVVINVECAEAVGKSLETEGYRNISEIENDFIFEKLQEEPFASLTLTRVIDLDARKGSASLSVIVLKESIDEFEGSARMMIRSFRRS